MGPILGRCAIVHLSSRLERPSAENPSPALPDPSPSSLLALPRGGAARTARGATPGSRIRLSPPALDDPGDRLGEPAREVGQLGFAAEHPAHGPRRRVLEGRHGGRRGRDEAVPATVRGLDEAGGPGVIAEGLPELPDAAGQHRWRDVRRGPHGVEQLVLRDQASRARRQVLEHREGLAPQRHVRAAAQQTTARPVELVGPERDQLIGRHGWAVRWRPRRHGGSYVGYRRLFTQIGCASCHVRSLTSGASPVAALRFQTFYPYSDFLLHDMGSLGDGIEQGQATGGEMRTAPLWGLRLFTAFLHDGRAGTIEEAILAHDGQGRAARDRFAALPAEEKVTLVAFLRTL